jgi:hypothetical protein
MCKKQASQRAQLTSKERNMANATIYTECCITVSAQMETHDYGVPGSPVWEEVGDTHIDEISIGNDTFTRTELRALIGQHAADWLIDQLVGDWGNIEWEN